MSTFRAYRKAAYCQITVVNRAYHRISRIVGRQMSEAASVVLMAMYWGGQVRSELPEKGTWEWIAAQIREHGLPKGGHPKKGSVDADVDRLADALLRRAERAIAELELNDRQRSYLIHVLRSRLRSSVTLADRRSSPRKL